MIIMNWSNGGNSGRGGGGRRTRTNQAGEPRQYTIRGGSTVTVPPGGRIPAGAREGAGRSNPRPQTGRATRQGGGRATRNPFTAGTMYANQ